MHLKVFCDIPTCPNTLKLSRKYEIKIVMSYKCNFTLMETFKIEVPEGL